MQIMKQPFILSIIVLICFLACQSKTKQATLNLKPDKRLLSYSQKIVYSVDSLEKLKKEELDKIYSSNLSPQVDTIKYLKNKIYISCLKVATGCGSYIPDIKFSDDTIKLDMHLISEVICPEQDVWRVTYVIENNDGKRYKVQKYL